MGKKKLLKSRLNYIFSISLVKKQGLGYSPLALERVGNKTVFDLHVLLPFSSSPTISAVPPAISRGVSKAPPTASSFVQGTGKESCNGDVTLDRPFAARLKI